MSDFTSVRSRLDINKSRAITSAEAELATPPLSKYQSIVKARGLSKIPVIFDFPVVNFGTFNTEAEALEYFLANNRCIAQYQVVASSDLIFLDNLLDNYPFYFMNDLVGSATVNYTLRFRVGEAVTRYDFKSTSHTVYETPYTNQNIRANFVLEAWLNISMEFVTPFTIRIGGKLRTSLLALPDTGDEVERTVIVGAPKLIDDLQIGNLPFALPVNNLVSRFNDNI